MASFRDRTAPGPPVQHWNAHTVSVRCPFCTNNHTHGFGGSYRSILRAPHCNYNSSISFLSYRFAYPFLECEGTVAYELDKSVGYFVALGATEIDSEVELLKKAFDELNLQVGGSSGTKGWKHATEMITIGIEDETFRCLHQAFGGGDTFTLKRLDHAVY
jgi:hypothetical protein